jgi:ribosomal protein S25
MSKTEIENTNDLVAKARAAAEKFRDPAKRKQKAEEPIVEASEQVAAEAKEEVGENHVLFVSRDHEAASFDVSVGETIIRGGPSQFDPRIIEWRVPKELADRFRKHHHFITQRIVEAK